MPVQGIAAIKSVAADLVPAIAFFAIGVYRDKLFFLVLGMFILVFMIVYRAFRQFKYAKLIKSISNKIIAHSKSHRAHVPE